VNLFLLTSNAQSITTLWKEQTALKQALVDANRLEDRATELANKVDNLNQVEVDKLDDFLPDSVDNLQLIVDINNIANESNMTLGEVAIEEADPKAVASSANIGGVPTVETTQIIFTTTGSYADLKTFLRNLALSLRLIDVVNLKFDAVTTDTGDNNYQITAQTYWLK